MYGIPLIRIGLFRLSAAEFEVIDPHVGLVIIQAAQSVGTD
jgi:hypothetical protein